MNFNKVGLVARPLFLALGMFLALPVVAGVAQAQDGYWNQDDRRERRQERRERRRERRRDRREDRRDDWRDDRRDDRYRYDDYNYRGSSQLRQTALNAGYNNGIQEGRRDRSRNERFNYSDESDYRKATEDYSSRLGDRELYRRYFREGFQNGYADGYQGY